MMNRSGHADLALINGGIYTVDAKKTWAEALTVSAGRITYVGSNKGATPHIGRDTMVLDLTGRMALPGFIDSHAHPPAAMTMVLSVNLYGLQSVQAYRESIAAFVQQNPEMVAIQGAGWSNTLFPVGGPSKTVLDEIDATRPLCLRSVDGHSFWVNSRALESAGITRETPDPDGGVIERNPSTGEPNGTLRESAMELIEAVLPHYSPEDRKIGLLTYQSMSCEFGLTTAHDAIASDAIDAYKAMEEEGLFTVRFRGSLLVDPGKGPEQVSALVSERARHTGPYFRTNSAKVFVDGVVEGETAYLFEPYAHRPEYRGELLWDPDHLKEVCVALDREGFQIHVHVIGDAATHITLDAFEHVQRVNGVRDARNLVTHLQLVVPEDIPRFAQLGVVGVPQPYWFGIDDYYWNLQLPYLGKQRADAEYPMQSFIAAGVVMASGSDFPVTVPCDPLNAIQMGVTRSRVGKNSDPNAVLAKGDWGVLWPEERASLEDMIASFTCNGAFANFLEDETGSLEIGKLADIVVLDRNLFEIPATEISGATVLHTFFEGREVYCARSV